MGIYTEIEDDFFVFASENVRYNAVNGCFICNNKTTISASVQEIPILGKVYSFCFPYLIDMPCAPIKFKNGDIKECNYFYSSASVWVNSMLVMLNTLGYKSFGMASKQLVIQKDVIHLPVITTNSNSSIYIEIKRTKDNINKIDFRRYLGEGIIKVYDIFPGNAKELKDNTFIPFVNNRELLVKVADVDNRFYFITSLQNGLDFLIKKGYRQSYLYAETIKAVSTYLDSKKVRGCKCRLSKYISALNRCKDWKESDLIFCDFLNLLIQKNIIINKLTLR